MLKKRQSKNIKFNLNNKNLKLNKIDSEILAKGKDSQLKERFIKIEKYKNIHYQNLIDFKKDCRLPEKDELIKIRVQKAYNAFTFILAIKEKFNIIDELSILTFNINERTLLTLFSWVETTELKSLELCISESVKSRMPKRVDLIKELFNKFKHKSNLKVAFTWNHCKIALVKAGGQYFVIEGSGNFSDNEEVEQYIFENSKKSYNFDKNNLIPHLLNKAKLQRRSKRGEILK